MAVRELGDGDFMYLQGDVRPLLGVYLSKHKLPIVDVPIDVLELGLRMKTGSQLDTVYVYKSIRTDVLVPTYVEALATLHEGMDGSRFHVHAAYFSCACPDVLQLIEKANADQGPSWGTSEDEADDTKSPSVSGDFPTHPLTRAPSAAQSRDSAGGGGGGGAERDDPPFQPVTRRGAPSFLSGFTQRGMRTGAASGDGRESQPPIHASGGGRHGRTARDAPPPLHPVGSSWTVPLMAGVEQRPSPPKFQVLAGDKDLEYKSLVVFQGGEPRQGMSALMSSLPKCDVPYSYVVALTGAVASLIDLCQSEGHFHGPMDKDVPFLRRIANVFKITTPGTALRAAMRLVAQAYVNSPIFPGEFESYVTTTTGRQPPRGEFLELFATVTTMVHFVTFARSSNKGGKQSEVSSWAKGVFDFLLGRHIWLPETCAILSSPWGPNAVARHIGSGVDVQSELLAAYGYSAGCADNSAFYITTAVRSAGSSGFRAGRDSVRTHKLYPELTNISVSGSMAANMRMVAGNLSEMYKLAKSYLPDKEGGEEGMKELRGIGRLIGDYASSNAFAKVRLRDPMSFPQATLVHSQQEKERRMEAAAAPDDAGESETEGSE